MNITIKTRKKNHNNYNKELENLSNHLNKTDYNNQIEEIKKEVEKNITKHVDNHIKRLEDKIARQDKYLSSLLHKKGGIYDKMLNHVNKIFESGIQNIMSDNIMDMSQAQIATTFLTTITKSLKYF